MKAERDAGADPGVEKRAGRQKQVADAQRDLQQLKDVGFTVRMACNAYWLGHVARHRTTKGANEIERMFNTMLGELAQRPAAQVTRREAFDLLESFAHPGPGCEVTYRAWRSLGLQP